MAHHRAGKHGPAQGRRLWGVTARWAVATSMVAVGLAFGAGSRVAHAATDGGRDTTFNPDGAGANGPIYDIDFTNDGKVYIAGSFTTYNGVTAGGLARLNANGTLDTTFNSGGAGFSHTTANQFLIRSIDVDSDGDVYVAGGFTSYNGTSAVSVVRLNSDGSLDSGFAPPQMEDSNFNGKPISPRLVRVFGETVYVSGKMDGLWIPADPDDDNSSGTPVASVAGMVAFDKTGTHISSFTPVLTNGASIESAYDMIPVPNSTDFYIFGTFFRQILRITTDGQVNTAYANNASPNLGPNNYIYAWALNPEGKLLIAGNFTQFNGAARNSFVRVNPDASLDEAFPSPSKALGIDAVAVDPKGKIYLSGGLSDVYGTVSPMFLGRLNADGTTDTTFDISTQPNTGYVDVEVSPTGQVYLYFSRANPDGTTKFGNTDVGYITRVNAASSASTGTSTGTSSGVPGKPTNIRVTINGSKAKVSWKAPATGGAPTSYTAVAVQGGVKSSSATITMPYCEATAPKTSCTISGLKVGKKYQFVVTAANDSGPSETLSTRGTVLVSSSTPEQTDSLPATGSSSSTWILSVFAFMLLAAGAGLRRLRRS